MSKFRIPGRQKGDELIAEDPVMNALHVDNNENTKNTEITVTWTEQSKAFMREANRRGITTSFASVTNIMHTQYSEEDNNAEISNSNKRNFSSLGDFILYNEHLMTVKALGEAYSTDINARDVSKSLGLSRSQAKSLLGKFGRNKLTPPAKLPLWCLFLLQFTSLYNILLLIAAFLSLIGYVIPPLDLVDLYIAVLLLMSVTITALVDCRQEAKSDEVMKSFLSTVPEAVAVVREGQLFSVDAEELVLGDVIRLNVGDRVPADCRIIENADLQVDQSILTGESDVVICSLEPSKDDPVEAGNIVFKGCLVLSGSCVALVIRTGDTTLIGCVTQTASSAEKKVKSLRTDVDAVVRSISKVSLLWALVIFIVGVSRGLPFLSTFIRGFIGRSVISYLCSSLAVVTHYFTSPLNIMI